MILVAENFHAIGEWYLNNEEYQKCVEPEIKYKGEIYAMCYRDTIVDGSFYFDCVLMNERILYLSENCKVYFVFKEVGDAFNTGLFVDSTKVSILGWMQLNRK